MSTGFALLIAFLGICRPTGEERAYDCGSFKVRLAPPTIFSETETTRIRGVEVFDVRPGSTPRFKCWGLKGSKRVEDTRCTFDVPGKRSRIFVGLHDAKGKQLRSTMNIRQPTDLTVVVDKTCAAPSGERCAPQAHVRDSVGPVRWATSLEAANAGKLASEIPALPPGRHRLVAVAERAHGDRIAGLVELEIAERRPDAWLGAAGSDPIEPVREAVATVSVRLSKPIAGASVRLNDHDVGAPPVTLSVPPGVHEIRVVAPNHRGHRTVMKLADEDQRDLVVALESDQTTSVELSCQGHESEVVFLQQRHHTRRLTRPFDVESGRHRIWFYRGDRVRLVSVYVGPGEHARVDCDEDHPNRWTAREQVLYLESRLHEDVTFCIDRDPCVVGDTLGYRLESRIGVQRFDESDREPRERKLRAGWHILYFHGPTLGRTAKDIELPHDGALEITSDLFWRAPDESLHEIKVVSMPPVIPEPRRRHWPYWTAGGLAAGGTAAFGFALDAHYDVEAATNTRAQLLRERGRDDRALATSIDDRRLERNMLYFASSILISGAVGLLTYALTTTEESK